MNTNRTAQSLATRQPTVRTIARRDLRQVKAVEIAADAGQWLKCRTNDGTKAYGIPSQSRENTYHLATRDRCSCPDFAQRQQPCKHAIAVRIHCDRVKARNGISEETRRLARRYDEIFGAFA